MDKDIEQGAIPEDQFRYRLLLARLHAGNLTTRQAAERCGLNYVSWSNWERGMQPRDKIDVAERVSEGLGVDLNWLIFGGPLVKPAKSGDTTIYSHAGADGTPLAGAGPIPTHPIGPHIPTPRPGPRVRHHPETPLSGRRHHPTITAGEHRTGRAHRTGT